MDVIVPRIPGERAIDAPEKDIVERLQQLRPYIRQSGDGWREPWLLKNRKLLDYLLVVIPDGNGRFTIKGKTYKVKNGDVFWIPPNTDHEMQGTERPMRCLYIHFDLLYDPKRSHWDACIPGGSIDLSPWHHIMHPPIHDPIIKNWCGKLPIVNTIQIVSLMETICLEHRRSPGKTSLKTSGLVLQLLHELLQGYAGIATPDFYMNKSIYSAATILRERTNCHNPIPDCAKELRMSTSHFRRCFREIFGSSPRAVHQQARMQKACALLVYTHLNISEISLQLGFSTVHNFSRAFHKAMGLSPTQYRQGRIE